MELQTKPDFQIKTPKIKAILSHKSYANIILCMYTGEINIFDPKTLLLKKSVTVSTTTLRTGAIIPSKDWIILATDDGNILVLDIGNYSHIETIKAHDDIIRKIIVDEKNERFITVSDDNRTKLWSYKEGIVLVQKYKDSKHYVMDVCFLPNDSNQFLTVSMDTKIRLYSVGSIKCLRTFKGHEGGINTIDFINSHNFVTGADDLNIIVWDLKSVVPLTVLKGHSGNINKIKAVKNGFISCSEDKTTRFWNNDFKCYNIINTNNRTWDVLYKDGKLYCGSDEDFVVYQEQKTDNQAFLCENKILYNIKNTLLSTKVDEIGVFKEMGLFDQDFTHFTVSNSGKLVSVFIEDQFTVYSILGMRKKYADKGNSLVFLENDHFIYLNNQKVYIVKKFEVEKSFSIEGCTQILYSNDEKFLCLVNGVVSLYSIDGKLLYNFNETADKAIIINDYFVLSGSNILVYDKKFVLICTFDNKIGNFAVKDDILFFNDGSKTNYIIFSEKQCYLASLKFCPNLFGIGQDCIYYLSDGIKQFKIDFDMILYQMNFLNGKQPKVTERIREKAISFLLSLKCYEDALLLCENENKKFEIFLALGRYEEALGSANSPIKHEKLGKHFYENGQMKLAADCFYKAGILDSLLLADLKGDRMYLGYIANEAKLFGKDNLAFLAAYMNQDYDFCSNLLRDTPFYNAFNQFYLE